MGREDLFARLLADDGLEPGHHLRKGVRSADRAHHVVGGVHVGNPVAERLVDGVLEGAAAGGHRDHGGAELFHPEDIGPLAVDIFLAHVDGAGKAELGGHGGAGHPVLARAGFGDHPRLAHAFDQQPLAHDVVGLVRPGVVEVLALDEDLRPAEMAAQVVGVGEGGGAAGIRAHEVEVLLPEGRVCLGFGVDLFQLPEGFVQHFRDIGAAPLSKIAWFIHGENPCRLTGEYFFGFSKTNKIPHIQQIRQGEKREEI